MKSNRNRIITFFPLVKGKNSAHKSNNGKREAVNLEQLHNKIQVTSWSPSIFDGDQRNLKSFKEANFLVLDVDSETSIIDAKRILDNKNLNYSITTSRNHQKIKNADSPGEQPACDRYRICVPIDDAITCTKTFYYNIRKLGALIPGSDAKCFEPAHFYFPSSGSPESNSLRLNENNYTITSPKVTEINLAQEIINNSQLSNLEYYLKNASSGIPGGFNDALNKAAYQAARAGITETEAHNMLEKVAPEPFDSNDEATFSSGFNAGSAKGEYKNLNSSAGPIEYINKFMTENAIQFNLSGEHRIGNEVVNIEYIKDLIYISAKQNKAPGVDLRLINSFLNIWQINKRKEHINELSNHIAFSGDNNLTAKLVNAITDKEKPLATAVIKHWIANIKRKIKNKPVKDHIMPNITGATGSGKSYCVSKTIEPLKSVVIESDLAMLNDSRNNFKLTENYIIFFDELARAKQADLNCLKQKITCPTVSYRKLGTNTTIKSPNNASFIGASNYDIKDVITDPTSSRRFYQIYSKEKCDWDEINSINYLELWRGVNDCTDIDHLAEFREELKQSQGEIRALDSVEEWLAEERLRHDPASNEAPLKISVRRAYEAYKYWMESQNRGRYIPSKVKFGRILTSHVGPSEPVAGTRYYNFSCQFEERFKEMSEHNPFSRRF